MSKPMLLFISSNACKSPAKYPLVEKSCLVLSLLLQKLGRRLTLRVLNKVKEDYVWVSPGPTVYTLSETLLLHAYCSCMWLPDYAHRVISPLTLQSEVRNGRIMPSVKGKNNVNNIWVLLGTAFDRPEE